VAAENQDHSSLIPGREDCVVGALLQRWARERPGRNFLEFADGSSWTFAEMLQRTRVAAAGLQQLGVKRGSHVLCWLPNSAEAVLAWFAANYLGAVFVPVNTAYRGNLLRNAVELSDAEVLVAHADLLPRLEKDGCGRLRDVIVVGGEVPAGDHLRYHPATILAEADDAALVEPDPLVQPWDINFIIFTSGTTGPSKAVLCTYVQTWVGGAMAMDYFGPDDRLLANLPLFHVSGAGAVMDRLTKGGTCVLYDGFRPDSFWDTVRQFRISGCCLVGAMTQFLLKQPPSERDRDHTLKSVITVPWNQDSLDVAGRYGLQMYTAFNMTEIATPIRSPANAPRLGTCGKPRPGIEARVVDAHDYEVPHGEVGELILRSSRPWEITQGYYRNPEATAEVWRNGWFHTGDAFRRDEEGYFYFVDRMKDAIRRRGENISSFEVESEATVHPAIREAAAIPVPSELGEDEVMLVVSLTRGQSVTPLELLQFMAPRMAYFMLPRYIRMLPELPKTPTAKIEKHRLRAEGISPDTWDREAHGVKVGRAGITLV
jgi:crotonobetaine/carnitine-CoA ligase